MCRRTKSIALQRPSDSPGRCVISIVKTTKLSEITSPIATCKMYNSNQGILFEKIEFNKNSELPTNMQYLYLDMVLSHMIYLANGLDKKSVTVASNLDILPELLLEYMFKLYPPSIIEAGKYLGVKALAFGDARTNYTIKHLRKLRKAKVNRIGFLR
jgi:hypothetical protein